MDRRLPALLTALACVVILTAGGCRGRAATGKSETVVHQLPSGWTIALGPEFSRANETSAIVFTAGNRAVRASIPASPADARRAIDQLSVVPAVYKQGRKTANIYDVPPNRKTAFVFFEEEAILRLDMTFASTGDGKWADDVVLSTRRAIRKR